MWDVDLLQVSSVVLRYTEKVQVIALLIIADLKHNTRGLKANMGHGTCIWYRAVWGGRGSTLLQTALSAVFFTTEHKLEDKAWFSTVYQWAEIRANLSVSERRAVQMSCCFYLQSGNLLPMLSRNSILTPNTLLAENPQHMDPDNITSIMWRRGRLQTLTCCGTNVSYHM